MKIMTILIACLTLSACGTNGTENQSKVDVGQFQVVYSPHVARDTFLVDTNTGKTWVLTEGQDTEGAKTLYWNKMETTGY